MKIKNFLVIFAVIAVMTYGCTQSNVTGKVTSEKKSMEAKESITNEGSKEDMEKDKAMMEEGFEMKEGKMMMVNEKTKAMSAMEKEMKLEDGTIIKTNGQILRMNGTEFKLKEGESIWMDGSVMKAGEMMKEDMMESTYKGKVLAGTKSKYLEYNKADYNEALKENKKILLYFYASWCPLCRKEQPETIAAFNELNDPNLVGFRVHYNDGDDSNDAKALAQQFQVPYQHTKVILKNGKMAGKFPDTWNKQRYIAELNKQG